MDTRPIVIIGAGECGTRAAFALREQGYAGKVVLLGGESVLPYERPPLSKEAITTPATPEPRLIATAGRFAEAGIAFLADHTAIRLDRAKQEVECHTADSTPVTLAYSRLLLATGSSPRTIDIPGMDGNPHCLSLRTFQDALLIRSALHAGKRLLILGGGLIGMELAASARQLGCSVTVIQRDPTILNRGVPDVLATALHERHRTEGVNIRCQAGIRQIETTADGLRVHLQDGDKVACDLVVTAIGAAPNTRLAQQSGLAVADGITVDACLQTSDPLVFAAGDCCNFPSPFNGQRTRLETWRNAQEQGTLAARNLLGQAEPIQSVPWFWSDQYDWGLQVAGWPELASHTVRRELSDNAVLLFHLHADGRLVAASGLGVSTRVAKDIRVADLLIARQASPDPALLADPAFPLKKLLK